MQIIKEGLTDQNEAARKGFSEYFTSSLPDPTTDFSFYFKVLDPKLLFMKEYYSQLPMIIIQHVF